MATAADGQGTTEASGVPLIEVVRRAWRARWWLLVGAALGAALGVAAGLVMTKQYRASVTLMVVTPNESRIGALGDQLGGIASLVGIDIGASTSKGEAVQTLRSQQLARSFIERKSLMPVLFAAEWDPDDASWRDADPTRQPTIERGVRKFRERVARVSEDKQAGTILVTVTWPDRKIAAQWANEIVALANELLRDRAVQDAQRSIEYLTAELRKTDIVETRESMYRLMDGHLRMIVVARTRADYALRTIDPGVAPDESDYVTPRRVVLALIGALLGFVAAAIVYALQRRPGGSTAARMVD
jgi:uncharacterized protein involved in exopolysaccharide biosynthesis